MSDRDSKKERVFGCGPQDPHARLQGRAAIDAGIAQGLSPMDVMAGKKKVVPGTANLKNR